MLSYQNTKIIIKINRYYLMSLIILVLIIIVLIIIIELKEYINYKIIKKL